MAVWALGIAACASGAATPAIVLGGSGSPGAPSSLWSSSVSPAPLRPRRPGVESYSAPASDRLRASIIPDSLRARVLERIREVARSFQRVEPVADPRVDAIAEDLAWGLTGTDAPSAEMADFLAAYYGFVEPGPQVAIIRAAGHSDGELVGYVADQLSSMIKSGSFALLGVGIRRQPEQVVLVVALQEKNVAIDPVPHRMAAGTAVRIQGRLLGDYTHPEVIVTLPDGKVREIPATASASVSATAAGAAADNTGFRADVRCDQGPGRYQIEIGGTGATGPAIRANFPVYCGMAPPSVAPIAPAPTHGGSWTAAEAEARLLDLVNRDRRAAGLQALVLDQRLSNVARAHSQDMADHDFVGHVSPTTGDPEARVRRAGFQPLFLAENAGLDSSPDGAHAGLMNSPGHRANILEIHATRVGIGVVMKKWPSGGDALLVTELFM